MSNMQGTDVWQLKNRYVRAWKNNLNDVTATTGLPKWALEALAAEKIELHNPEQGHILVRSEYIGDHVCEPGQYLTLSSDDPDAGHIMACDSSAFEKAYEPSPTPSTGDWPEPTE